jgi:hypothetical protein
MALVARLKLTPPADNMLRDGTLIAPAALWVIVPPRPSTFDWRISPAVTVPFRLALIDIESYASSFRVLALHDTGALTDILPVAVPTDPENPVVTITFPLVRAVSSTLTLSTEGAAVGVKVPPGGPELLMLVLAPVDIVTFSGSSKSVPLRPDCARRSVNPM